MSTLAREDRRVEIVRRLRALRADSPRRWGRMSAHQAVCHLSDAFRMALGQRSVAPATGRRQRTAVKWMALYVPLPWPTGIMTLPELDQTCTGTSPVEFAADLRELEALLEAFVRRRGHYSPQHPIFGRMSTRDWLRWAYRHTDHHLRQFGV